MSEGPEQMRGCHYWYIKGLNEGMECERKHSRLSPETVERIKATLKLYDMTYNDLESVLRDFLPPALDLLRDILKEVEG